MFESKRYSRKNRHHARQAPRLKSSTMPSEVDNAKRELVKLLRSLSQRYQLRLDVSRDSSDKEVSKAFKKVSLRVHPDKGGEQADFQLLSATNDTWQELVKRKGAVGRPPTEAKAPRRKTAQACVLAAPAESKEYRVCSRAARSLLPRLPQPTLSSAPPGGTQRR